MKLRFVGVALLLLAIGVVVCAVWWGSKARKPYGHFTVYQVETVVSWAGEPKVALNNASIKKLNAELEAMIEARMPGRGLHYPVVSLGEQSVEVMYMSDKQNVPDDLRAQLDEYIRQRISQLAVEQIRVK